MRGRVSVGQRKERVLVCGGKVRELWKKKERRVSGFLWEGLRGEGEGRGG